MSSCLPLLCSGSSPRSLWRVAARSHSQTHELCGCIFVGHTNADLDSVASAIGAAWLYDGEPARASEMDAETQHVLARWNVQPPAHIEDLMAERGQSRVCLVDFQQATQLHSAVAQEQASGHHT
eukprot:scaffold244684_cov29-Tisochrysis_lutea.AAC.3